MIEKRAKLIVEEPVDRVVRRLHEELAYIGRQMNANLSPQTSLWRKLAVRKEVLRKELEKLPRLELPPEKMPKRKRHQNTLGGVNTVSNIIYQHYYKKSRAPKI